MQLYMYFLFFVLAYMPCPNVRINGYMLTTMEYFYFNRDQNLRKMYQQNKIYYNYMSFNFVTILFNQSWRVPSDPVLHPAFSVLHLWCAWLRDIFIHKFCKREPMKFVVLYKGQLVYVITTRVTLGTATTIKTWLVWHSCPLLCETLLRTVLNPMKNNECFRERVKNGKETATHKINRHIINQILTCPVRILPLFASRSTRKYLVII